MSEVNARRVLWSAPGVVTMEDVRIPEPGPGEVLVEAEISLISPGTERAFLLNLENTSGNFPSTGGYSLVGQVVRHGEGVSEPAIGSRVVCAVSHASHSVVRANRCVVIPEGLASEEAVFFNLGAIALQGVRKARVELGEGVAVFGAGLIGLLAMRLAKLSGGMPVVSLDLHESRRALARAFGADDALDPSADEFDAQLTETFAATAIDGDRAPQVVIEATGFPQVVLTAFRIAGWMARIVLLGSSRGTTPDVNFYRDVHKKGLTLLGAHASTIPSSESAPTSWTWRANVRTVLQLLASGRLSVEPLVTHRVAADDAPSIYAKIAEWDPSVLGALLRWRTDAR